MRGVILQRGSILLAMRSLFPAENIGLMDKCSIIIPNAMDIACLPTIGLILEPLGRGKTQDGLFLFTTLTVEIMRIPLDSSKIQIIKPRPKQFKRRCLNLFHQLPIILGFDNEKEFRHTKFNTRNLIAAVMCDRLCLSEGD
jgi:hypothetical protein